MTSLSSLLGGGRAFSSCGSVKGGEVVPFKNSHPIKRRWRTELDKDRYKGHLYLQIY